MTKDENEEVKEEEMSRVKKVRAPDSELRGSRSHRRVARGTDTGLPETTRSRDFGDAGAVWSTSARLHMVRGHGGTLGVGGGGGRGTLSLCEPLVTVLDDGKQFLVAPGINALAQHADLAFKRGGFDEHVLELPERQFRHRVHSGTVASMQRAQSTGSWSDFWRLDRRDIRCRYDGRLRPQ